MKCRWPHRSGLGSVAALVCFALVSLTGCGGGGSTSSSGPTTGASAVTSPSPGSSPSPSEIASPLPTGPKEFPKLRNSERHLSEGTYVTSTFDAPVLTVTLPGDWTFYDQGPTNLQLNMGTGVHLESSLSLFNYFGRVIDPGDDHSITETSDLISWIEQHPHLEVIGKAESVHIAGFEGQEIDFRPSGMPLCTYFPDGSRCWNLMPIIDGDPFSPANQELGTMFVVSSDVESPDVPFTYRLALVDIDGSQVVFVWQEDGSVFDETVQTFEQVLASIEVGA
jgi:hypothetical protein